MTTSNSLLRGLARPQLTKIFSTASSASPAVEYSGFTLQNSFALNELKLHVFDFKHTKSGAQYVHLDTDDTNNAFCIGFRSPAPNSKGITHVLEHSVLCGSEKFPVKDPFFHMTRRSFSTFMNAMTAADCTMYPFSTVNDRDFSNLLRVYLDAVFFPLLREQDFLQEAHRLEENDKNNNNNNNDLPLKFNGVVFNEMRGVVTDPRRHFYHQLRQHVLPGTHYEYISGGDPLEIPDMSHQELKEFHSECYIPQNSLTLTYGDLNPLANGTMKLLDEYFTRKMETSSNRSLMFLPKLEKWPLVDNINNNSNDKDSIIFTKGPASMAGDPSTQTRAAIAFAIPELTDSSELKQKFMKEEIAKNNNTLLNNNKRQLETRFHIRKSFEHGLIEELLCSGPASPMYKALVSEGALGSAYSTGTGFASSRLSTAMCSFGAESLRSGVEPQRVFDTVLKTIDGVVSNNSFGDARRTDAALFQQELSLRHRSTSRGINLLTSAVAVALVKDFSSSSTIDPCHVLDSLTHLQELSKDQTQLVNELRRCTLDNMQNSIRLVCEAEKEFIEKKQTLLDEKCKDRVTKLSPKEIEEHLAKMKTWKEERDVENKKGAELADKYLPTMKKSDISIDGSQSEDPQFNQVAPGVFVTTEVSTNDLVYVNALLPLSDRMRQVFSQIFDDDAQNINEEEQLLKQIFHWNQAHTFVSTLGTTFADAEELDTLENLCSLGFSFSPSTTSVWDSQSEQILKHRFGTYVGFRTTHEKLPEAMKLLAKIVRGANILSTSPSSSSSSSCSTLSWEKSHKRFLTRLTSIASGTISGATQRGHSIAQSVAYTRLTGSHHHKHHVISDHTGGGLSHLETFKTILSQCNEMLKLDEWKEASSHPKLNFSSETANNTSSAIIDFAKGRDQFVAELPTLFEKAIWWCAAEKGKEQEILNALKEAEVLPQAHQIYSEAPLPPRQYLDQLFDLSTLSSPSTKTKTTENSITTETKKIPFPTDTSFAAIVKANDELGPLHKDHTNVQIAAQIAKSEFFHTEIREKGGSYGAFCSLDTDGSVAAVSYRDPQPDRSIDEVFVKTGDWISQNDNLINSNVTENSVDQALLRIFAGLDAPRTPASFGDRYFFHSITPQHRQLRRKRYLETTVDDVRKVGKKYFCNSEAIEEDRKKGIVASVIVQPEEKSSTKK